MGKCQFFWGKKSELPRWNGQIVPVTLRTLRANSSLRLTPTCLARPWRGGWGCRERGGSVGRGRRGAKGCRIRGCPTCGARARRRKDP